MATISTTLTLIDNMSKKLNTIRDAVGEVESNLKAIGDNQDALDKFSWNTFISNAEAAGKKMEQIGKTMSLAITTPLTLFGKKMYGNAVDYESAFAGVKKTTDATEEEYSQLYQGLLDISETNPTGFVDAAAIMEMAGQLGVAKDELLGFTEAYIGLQESTNIQGEGGAADIARFLNVTEKSTANIDRVGGVIVGLGNNFATTEQEILAMATRMGATADLAGFSAPEILAFSAALSSVGINAEAGGSAAGKLMKKMQLAAEVGGKAQETLDAAGFSFSSGLEAQNWLDSLKSSDASDIAYSMGMTKDSLDDMVKSWVALDQFSEVMGLDRAGFMQSWDEGAAVSMLRFFQGLGNLDADSGNSVLAQLAEMDLTEIRLSNLVAAMAGNSDLFQAALDEAYRQYNLDPNTNAMAEEVAKRYATQESQNAMLGNKLNNTMADFGQNLVEALQPALDIVNDILDAFNKMSETDQTALIKTLGAIALLGPALTIAGRGMQMIASGLELASKFKGAESAVETVAGVGAGKAVGGASGAASGLGGGSLFAGGAALAGVAYMFKKGADYREEYGELGSIEAIANGTHQNQELQAAFVEFVQSQADLENAANNFWDYTEQEQAAIADRATQASEAFYSYEDAANLMHLYNDWRDTNGMTRMDWALPEGLDELFSQAGIDAGQNLPAGVGDGISTNESAATSAAETMGTNTIDAANAGLGVNSPSVYMIESGLNVVQGLAMGMTSGSGVAIAAILAVANSTIAAANSVLNQATGHNIGFNVAAGIASGIRSGTGIAAAAARALANNVVSTLRASLQVHSPSRVTYEIGDDTGIGFVNGILDNRSRAEAAVGRVVKGAQSAWNAADWSNIGLFADLENNQLLDDAKDAVKVSDADIRKIRDLAEREVINHFTTAEVKVEMHNTNEIKSAMDLDGIVDYLGDKVSERLEAIAEGVYS